MSTPRHALVFPKASFDELRRSLLADVRETAAFVLAAPVRTPSGAWRLLARDVIALDPSDYTRRTATEIELPPAVVARVMQRARAARLSVVLAHSHPMLDAVNAAEPSLHDRAGEARVIPALRRRVPDMPHGRMIIAPRATRAAIFPPNADERVIADEPAAVLQIGRDIVQVSSGSSASSTDDCSPTCLLATTLDQTDDQRFDRQVRAFGTAGQRVLAQFRVAIVGLGGTGSFVAQQLAHLGVRGFLLIDHDTVDRTSLNRLIGGTPSDIGRPKVDVAADMIRTINPNASIEVIRSDVCSTSIARHILDVDCFFSCTDSHGSRWVLTRLAYQHFLPGFDLGVAIQTDASRVTHIAGRIQMLSPGLACLACGTELNPEQVRRDLLAESQRAADPYIVGAQAGAVPQPAVISINGVAASLAITMFLSAVTGIPNAARSQRMRLETGVVARLEATPQPECILCSAHGLFGTGDAGGDLGRPGE